MLQFNKPITFNRACIFSIILHGIILFVLSVVLHLIEAPYLYTPPLVFDFVFAPAQDYDKSNIHQDDSEETARSLDKNKKNPAPESGKKSKMQNNKIAKENSYKVIDNETPDSQKNVNESTDLSTTKLKQPSIAQLLEPSYVPEAKSESNIDKSFVINQFNLSSLPLPRTRMSAPDLISAKIAMTPKQHKMLGKKIKKWTENLDRMDWPDSTYVWKHKGKMYTARLHHIPANNETDIDEVLIEVTTEENGFNLSTNVRMKRLAFSNFTQFVDYWDPRVAIHDDVLDGRFHTNTTFNVSQTYGVKPKFNGKVTTASYEVRPGGRTPFIDQKSIFLGGIETGVKAINLPRTQFSFLNDTLFSENNLQVFSEETWITFYGDGSFTWKTSTTGDEIQRRALSKNSFYIVGSKKKKTHIKGVIKGKVLVYSPGKIIIDDDLTYAHHPEIYDGSEDYLGLVSDKDIEIAHPSITGGDDLHIFASIYAKGRFRVRHLWRKRGATLYIYGSLTAGSLSATEPRYATHIQFDERLANRRPPNFPVTDRYEIKEWDGQWQVKPK